MNIIRLVVTHLFLAVLLTSCGSDKELIADGRLEVVATTGMVADLVQQVGGDSVRVVALMGPGVDPHLYKATQGDLSRLRSADIVFYNGLHLEGKMGEVFEKLSVVKPVVAVAEGIPESELLADPAYEGAPDPHIWFDVRMWASTIDVVLNALVEERPEYAGYFKSNAARYRDTLIALDQWVRNTIADIPESQRVLVTAHDAFNYFGRAYGMEVRGLQGISTLSEFGLKDRVDLVNFIVERGIRAVYIETSVSERNIRSIIEGCRRRGHEVVIGGQLYSDAMGAPGTPEGTYVGMVRKNVAEVSGSVLD